MTAASIFKIWDDDVAGDRRTFPLHIGDAGEGVRFHRYDEAGCYHYRSDYISVMVDVGDAGFGQQGFASGDWVAGRLPAYQAGGGQAPANRPLRITTGAGTDFYDVGTFLQAIAPARVIHVAVAEFNYAIGSGTFMSVSGGASPAEEPTSIDDIDLTPIAGKTYFTTDREWREEFIYFLMVDRFHDGVMRNSVTVPGRSAGFSTKDDFCGGKIKGITQNLDYIAGLGCTSVWISSPAESNSYHGYDINNYLKIHPKFGTEQDLADLVDAAHQREPPIRIILDVVINHSGDNWKYPGDAAYKYCNDQQFPLSDWRWDDRPIPKELRNEVLYHRRGQIQNWDSYPETRNGDIVSLKDYVNDDTPEGSKLINILIKTYCYWIRNFDIDGFRVDAVKHLGELACSRFCSAVREYAYSLGKRNFFLFGEAAADDKIIDGYTGPNTSIQDGENTVFFGLDSTIDFPTMYELKWVLKGFHDPQALFRRLDAMRQRALNRGELGRYRMTCADNHDSIFNPGGRIANGASDEQVIAIIGYLLCALGTPCIYYGTEQGFVGAGNDNAMREAMFDAAGSTDLLNTNCNIYSEIGKIAAIMRAEEALRFGRMYFRQISGDNGDHFGFPYGNEYTLAFSRLLYPNEVLIAYNVSDKQRNDCVVVDADYHSTGQSMNFLYPGTGSVEVKESKDGTRFVPLSLKPHQFVILG